MTASTEPLRLRLEAVDESCAPVLLLWCAQTDAAVDSVTQVDLTIQVVPPGGGVGVCRAALWFRVAWSEWSSVHGADKPQLACTRVMEFCLTTTCAVRLDSIVGCAVAERTAVLYWCLPSKSAMNCVAPLLSALMTILRSTGPVISTRRSTIPGAGGGPCHVGSARMAAVSGRKSAQKQGSTWGLLQVTNMLLRITRRPFACSCCNYVCSVADSDSHHTMHSLCCD